MQTAYSNKSTEVQQLIDEIYQWGLETFKEHHKNPQLSAKLKEEAEELFVEVQRLKHLQKEDFGEKYLEDITGSDQYIAKQIVKQEELIKAELADCLIMLFHVSKDLDITFNELISAVKAKFEINKLRRWNKPDTNGIINHK